MSELKPVTDENIKAYIESCRKLVRVYDTSQEGVEIIRKHVNDKFIADCMRQNDWLAKFYTPPSLEREVGHDD